MQHVRDVQDPEHPYTLEQLKVVSEDDITVKDDEGRVRCAFAQPELKGKGSRSRSPCTRLAIPGNSSLLTPHRNPSV